MNYQILSMTGIAVSGALIGSMHKAFTGSQVVRSELFSPLKSGLI